MRVRCIAEKPTPEQVAALGNLIRGAKQVFGVILGTEYLVFGMSVVGGVVLVDVAQEFEQLVPVPLCLFEITDPRVPGLWEARAQEDGTLTLWPPSFYEREYYFQDLAEQAPGVSEDFRRVRRLLEVEGAIG